MSVCRLVLRQMPSRISRLSAKRDLAGADALGLQLVQRDAVLEQHHQQERIDRVAEEVRAPLLVLAHPQDAVADVAVHPDDVRVGVVHVVVRVAPLVGRAGGVPFEPAAGDRRIAHPVVLAVHHVVADLHVVDDLRQAQHRGARQPERREDAAEQQRPPADLEAALRLDDPADVGGVALAEIGDHAFLECVELAAERLGLLGGHGDGLACDGLLERLLGQEWLVTVMSTPFVRARCRRRRRGRTRRSARPPRSALDTAPVMRLRHRAAGLAAGAAVADAHPASAFGGQARGLGLLQQRPAVVGRRSTPLSVKDTRPPEASAGTSNTGGTKLSDRTFAQCSRTASTKAGGPQTNTRVGLGHRGGQVLGTESARRGRSLRARGCSRAAPERPAWRRARRGSTLPRRTRA